MDFLLPPGSAGIAARERVSVPLALKSVTAGRANSKTDADPLAPHAEGHKVESSFSTLLKMTTADMGEPTDFEFPIRK